ncbi:DUF5709 domain-containing protein [Kitasatospora sp. DSM 101779]|uniref:DUF5709 domain-containing protein n=1 Tax=Kitasatospora sp. DSM 101779 TaxID=2853165 RepID=UPI0021D8337A|nr:DUF5709 domain-containing protein [Kitasatospora sp. DSM 101779]MCU7826942.1 hypothetical protein [Kitasatospora sp. DSM 101779]
MSDSGRADEVYQPADTADEQADASALDLQNALDERTYDDLLDEGWSPPERPLAVRQPGTTAGEQREGESLDQRLARELPDQEADRGDLIGDLPGGDGEPVDPEAGAERAGRLVAPDEGAHARTTELFAEDVGIDAGAACAEEAAVHIVSDSALDGQGDLDEDAAWP